MASKNILENCVLSVNTFKKIKNLYYIFIRNYILFKKIKTKFKELKQGASLEGASRESRWKPLFEHSTSNVVVYCARLSIISILRVRLLKKSNAAFPFIFLVLQQKNFFSNFLV